jgi:CelD/BcsL family acetyltransferase involved in cellulose biosynthesis
MMDIQVDVVRPQELTSAEQDLWNSFIAAEPAHDSPFLSLRYTLLAGAVVPGARVAVVRRSGDTVGFLPFQRRGGLLQPLGAPLTDYHGLVAKAGEDVDIVRVVKGAGGRSYRFSGLLSAPPQNAARSRGTGWPCGCRTGSTRGTPNAGGPGASSSRTRSARRVPWSGSRDDRGAPARRRPRGAGLDHRAEADAVPQTGQHDVSPAAGRATC